MKFVVKVKGSRHLERTERSFLTTSGIPSREKGGGSEKGGKLLIVGNRDITLSGLPSGLLTFPVLHPEFEVF